MIARPPMLLLLLPLAVPGPAQLAGRLEGDVYHSATGAFRLPVPVSPALGGRIFDTPNAVTFADNYDTYVSIACFPLDLPQKWELASRGQQAYLHYFFTTFVLPDFERRYPGSRVEATRFLPELHDGALGVFCLLPGGSHFDFRHEIDPAQPTRPPATAKRGNLLFVKAGHVFVLSAELAERVTMPSSFALPPEAENDRLQARLLALARRLTFTPAATAAR